MELAFHVICFIAPYFSCRPTPHRPTQDKVKKIKEKLAIRTVMYDRKVARIKRKAEAKAVAAMAKKSTMSAARGFLLCNCLRVPLRNSRLLCEAHWSFGVCSSVCTFLGKTRFLELACTLCLYVAFARAVSHSAKSVNSPVLDTPLTGPLADTPWLSALPATVPRERFPAMCVLLSNICFVVKLAAELACLGLAGAGGSVVKKIQPLRLPVLKAQKMPVSLIEQHEDPAKQDCFFGHLDARQPRGRDESMNHDSIVGFRFRSPPPPWSPSLLVVTAMLLRAPTDAPGLTRNCPCVFVYVCSNISIL